MRKLLFIMFILTFQVNGFAQKLEISTSQDLIKIGEQLDMKVKLTAPEGAEIVMPLFQDTIHEKIEILSEGKLDTINENGLASYIRTYRLTSFDSGFYAIKPKEAVVNGDTILSNAFLIGVQTFEIDTANQYFDIKPIAEIPRSFLEILKEYWHWPAALLAIVVLIILLIRYFKNREKHIEESVPEVRIPPYETAIKRLTKLNEEQLWQNNKTKAYYSELTEILRWFIEEEYKVPALEQTTEEFMQSLKHLPSLSDEYRDKIHRLLYSADLVKFAKEKPVGTENELHFEMTKSFIEMHKPIQMDNNVA